MAHEGLLGVGLLGARRVRKQIGLLIVQRITEEILALSLLGRIVLSEIALLLLLALTEEIILIRLFRRKRAVGKETILSSSLT